MKNKKTLFKYGLLVTLLLVLVMVFSGCIGGGSRPIGWSGMAFAGDSLYFGATTGEIVAITIENGRSGSPMPLEEQASNGGGCLGGTAATGIYGTPVIVDGIIYIGGAGLGSDTGRLYMIDITNGEVIDRLPRDGIVGPIIGGPVVADGVVYVASIDANVYAFDTTSGSEIWRFETEDKIWATPVLHQDTLIIGSFDKKLYAIDIADGSLKWSYEAGGPIAAEALVFENTVYFGSFDRSFYAVNLSDGSSKWQFTAGSWFWAAPLEYNGEIYAPCLDKNVYVLDAAQGTEIEKYELSGQLVSSPVLLDNMIVVATKEGKLHIINGDTRSIRLLVDLRILADLELSVSAPLAASEGIIYIHAQGKETVYAINLETREVVWQKTVE